MQLCPNPQTRSGYAVVRQLVERADVLIDPFRPGVMERLKLGPELFLGDPATGSKGINEKLIYARLVGFPRTGGYTRCAALWPVLTALLRSPQGYGGSVLT